MLNLDTLYSDYARAQAYPESYKSGLEEEIRKSIGGNVAIAGYQTAAQADAASEFSPLVPEALDDIIGQVDFRAEQLEFFDWLPKKDTKNTVTTWMKTVENGDPWLERALSEGLISVNDNGRNTRGSTKIKSYVETRELTDIQNAVPLAGGGANGVGVPSSALAFQTTKGMLALHRALERDSMFGDATNNPNKIDGVQTQLKAAGQFTNMDGAQVTMEYLEDLVRTLQSAPYYGRPTDILVSPKIYTSLTKQQIAFGRRAMDGSSVTYGFDEKGGLVVLAGNQRIPVKPLVFQDNQADAPPAFGTVKENTAIGAPAPAYPTIAAGFGSAASAVSYFGAGDVGVYYYHVVAYSDAGAYSTMALTAGANALTITSVAGQKNTFTIDNPTGATVLYYHIFRSRKGASAADGKDVKKLQFLFTVAKTVGGATVVNDINEVRNDSGSVMVLRRDPEEIVMYQLIKLFRKPLAQTRMSQPFALFTACGLQVKVPEHQWLLTNVGY
jgi:hypothetical protein